MKKRKLGEIWKEGKFWKIQYPKGVWTTTTKAQAKIVSKTATSDYYAVKRRH